MRLGRRDWDAEHTVMRVDEDRSHFHLRICTACTDKQDWVALDFVVGGGGKRVTRVVPNSSDGCAFQPQTRPIRYHFQTDEGEQRPSVDAASGRGRTRTDTDVPVATDPSPWFQDSKMGEATLGSTIRIVTRFVFYGAVR